MEAAATSAPAAGKSSLPYAHRAEASDSKPQRAYQPLVTLVAAVSIGICADHFGGRLFAASGVPQAVGISWFGLWCWAATACLVFWGLRRRRWPRLAAISLFLAAASAGAAWHQARWSLFDRYEIGRYAGREPGPICIEGVVSGAAERVRAPQPTPLRAIPGGERTRLTLSLRRIRDGTLWRTASGKCQLMIEGHLLGVHPGDRIQVFGQAARVASPLNPGEFDFAAHARADRQLVRIRSSAPNSVTVLQRGASLEPSRILGEVRSGAKRNLARFVTPQYADLANAILLGSRGGLTAEETEPYLLTGTIHVLVVSGLNVAILAFGLYFLMRVGWLARKTGLAVIMLVVVAYALVTEAQPPVIRAAVFAVLLCIGAWSGRRGAAFNSLAVAALVVLAINPNDLFRAGPQLSFLAVGVLVWIGAWRESRKREAGDPLDDLLAAARPWPLRAMHTAGRWAGWLLVTSLAVWLITLPLLLNQFHVASPIAVLISPAVWIVVFAAMWSGFLLLTLGWLIPAAGVVSGWVCSGALSGLESLVEWAESLPGGHFWAPGPAWWWVVVFYVALLAATIRGRMLLPWRWQVAALSAWIVVGLSPPLVRSWQHDDLECSFIAVGHGTCVLLQTPTGETLLYDAGSLAAPEFATQTIASYLWHRGILRIDGILVSHADIDHYNAVPGLLQRFPVGAVYVSPMMFDGMGESSSRGPEVLRAAIRDAGVPIRQIWAGDRLRAGPDVILDVLHPTRTGVIGSDNANSMIVAVEHAGRAVLLPGDLESPGIESVTAELPYDCDVLLAPHHGSRLSDPPGFAAWSTPEWVVISGRKSDDLRAVVQTYEQAGARVLQTNRHGMVQFSIRSGTMEMANWVK
jgi:competence protein ComEC